MSAGRFQNTRYLADADTVHRIRVQPETLALNINGTANDPATNAVNNPISARVSGSRRKLGLSARMVRIRFTGAVPDGYVPNSVISVPWLSRVTFGNFQPGAEGEYLGLTVEVVGKVPETTR